MLLHTIGSLCSAVQVLHAEVAAGLGELLAALVVECHAVCQVAGGSDHAK